ncbi:MAG: Trm112 family protein [Pseudomonadota bacterium]
MTSSWFDLLVCPITKAPLRHDASQQLLIADAAGKAYPIRDGIPVLLAEEALEWPLVTLVTPAATLSPDLNTTSDSASSHTTASAS